MVKLQSISASSRWLQCTASLLYNLDFKSSLITLKGNLIHEVASLKLDTIFNNIDHEQEIFVLKTEDFVDEKDVTLKVKWDKECEDTCKNYIAYATSLYNEFKPYKVELEKKVNLKWYGFEKYGFIDLVMFCEDKIIIVDLKTGRVKVETEDNTQMLLYTIALIQTLFSEEEEPNIEKYIISICQPLAFNTTAIEYNLDQLIDFYDSQKYKMQEILQNDLKYSPSKVACKYCSNREKCNERIKKGIL